MTIHFPDPGQPCLLMAAFVETPNNSSATDAHRQYDDYFAEALLSGITRTSFVFKRGDLKRLADLDPSDEALIPTPNAESR